MTSSDKVTSGNTSTQLNILFGGHSIAGKKEQNDDAFSAHLPQNHAEQELKGAVACIADGVSNSQQAQIASQTSVTHFINDYYSTPESWSVQQSASRVITSINSWLFNYGSQTHTRTDSAVTTFSAAVIKSQTAHIIHAGDSRVYLFRNQQLKPLTRDHSQQRNNRTSKSSAQQDSYLTRALGIDYKLDLDYRREILEDNDMLLLSTDGLHEFLSDQQITACLQTYLEQSKNISLETTAHQLVTQALKNGSDDNISCLLVHAKHLPSENLQEAHQRLSNLVIPPVLKVGNQLDHFIIKRILHSSTRSHVYLAEDERNGERVVIKAPSKNFADDTQYLASFRREYWLGRKLNSSYVMKILPHPSDTRFIYHICEYIEGQTLRQWMIDNPAPSLESVRSIAKEIVAALRILHRNSVIHRDLKPENILIDPDGNIKLIDLGTAQIAGLDEIANVLELDQHHCDKPVGDIAYIAPEYLLGSPGSNQSDLFSLGCIVYEMLSAELPFNAIKSNRHYPTRLEQWQYKSLNITQNNSGDTPSAPKWLDKVLQKATAPQAEQRYAALSEFITDLFTPSADILKTVHQQPLMERNPTRVWQLVSAAFAIIIMVQWWYISSQ